MKQVIVVLLVFTAYSLTSARRCYICGNGSEEPFRTGGRGRQVRGTDTRIKSSVSCTEFERSSSMDQFIMECPEDFVGCITQIDGNEIVRTCDSLPLNDCQTANGVKYCYCNTDLCNGKMVTPPTRNVNENHRKNHHTREEEEDITDDEDFMEASGMGNDPSRETDRNTLDNNNYDDSLWSTANIQLTTRHPSQKASKSAQAFVNLPILTFLLLFLIVQ